jgi:hypothetical protein
MKINLLTFSSSLSQRDSIVEDHHELLNRIAEKYELNYVFPEDLGSSLPAGPTMVFVESGGVEEHVAALCRQASALHTAYCRRSEELACRIS